MKKKILSLISVVLIILSLLCTGTYAASEISQNSIRYNDSDIKNGVAIIITQPLTGDIIVPQKIQGKQVVELSALAFKNQEHITSITLPEGLKEIGTLAFDYCHSLKSIYIPSSVEYIDDQAFRGGFLPNSSASGSLAHLSSLTDIFFGGTEKQWNNLTDGNGLDYFGGKGHNGKDFSDNVTVHFNCTGIKNNTHIPQQSQNTGGSFSPTPQQGEKNRLATPKASVTSKTIKVGEVPEFTWEGVPHAEYYTIWSWTQNKCYEKISSLRARSILTPCAKTGTYNYSIYAIDADGKYKQSEPADFTITVTDKPRLETPKVKVEKGTIRVGESPEFSWNAVPHSDYFTIWTWKYDTYNDKAYDNVKTLYVRDYNPDAPNTSIPDALTGQKRANIAPYTKPGVYAISIYARDADGNYKQSEPASFNITVY